MKRSEYEKKMADLQDQIEELKKVEIEKDDKRWKPSLNENYYYMSGSGQILYDTWLDTLTGNNRYAIGNCFKTQEEAKFAVEKLKVLAELKEFAEPFNTEWDGNDGHWYINYDRNPFCLDIDHMLTCKGAELYFTTRDDAVKAIKKVGEERIKKYYLGIKESED